jgi:thiamine pyrophosphate-dependent acetolactate synthase large subunit-like protein
MVRDYVKWDDAPVSLSHFAESAVRAYSIAMTPPYEPVVIVADGTLQEEPITEKNLRIPKLALNAPPQGDSGAVNEAAKLLVAAENPVIVVDKMARTEAGRRACRQLGSTDLPQSPSARPGAIFVVPRPGTTGRQATSRSAPLWPVIGMSQFGEQTSVAQ